MSLAGSLQAVNSSLASFLTAILTVAYVLRFLQVYGCSMIDPASYSPTSYYLHSLLVLPTAN